MRRLQLASVVLALAAGAWAYSHAVSVISHIPRSVQTVEMATALPRFVQVAMAAGDRHLAANIAVFRALVASTEKMARDNFKIQALIQSDAAWLNPAHEDNYYIAAAILPWNGEVAPSMRILRAATRARPRDFFPPFYLAFGHFHFERRPTDAARMMQVAAERTDNIRQRQALESIAARWYARDEDIDSALSVLHVMAANARTGAFRRFLEKRIQRLEGQRAIAMAVMKFRDRNGRLPLHLAELQQSGMLPEVPKDPLGGTYGLDQRGAPIVIDRKGK